MRAVAAGLSLTALTILLAACGGDPEVPTSSELTVDEKIAVYQEMLQARDNVYLQRVTEATSRPVTDPDSVIKSAFVICGHIAQADGPEEWLEFSTAFANNVGISLEQAGTIFGATIQGYCPVLEDHYFNTVVKTN